MTVLWQPGFSKDGSALCMCVCTRVRVCVLHGTCSSYSVTNSLPNERQRISYFPLNFSGACSCSDQQTVTETMLCDFCGHSLFVTLSVAPSLSVFPLSLSFHVSRTPHCCDNRFVRAGTPRRGKERESERKRETKRQRKRECQKQTGRER